MFTISGNNLCESCFEKITNEPCPHCGFIKENYHPDSIALPCGSVLQGRYKIGKVLGKGGFGITYLSYDVKLERKIVIKEYYPDGIVSRDADATSLSVTLNKDTDSFKKGADKFYNEARIIAKFNGEPGIISIYDLFYENFTAYYTMEFLQGVSLKEYIKKHGVLSAKMAFTMLKTISPSLLAVHNENILHKDISPDNTIVCDSGKIKLIDFGAAHHLAEKGESGLSVIVKPGFTPLEQYQQTGTQGAWSDIYSLGMTLYFGMTGNIPPEPMSRMEDDSNFEKNLASIPQSFADVIKKMTQIKADNRYKNIDELIAALDNININDLNDNISSDNNVEEPEHTVMIFQDDEMDNKTVDDIPEQTSGEPIIDEIEVIDTSPVVVRTNLHKKLLAGIIGGVAAAAIAVTSTVLIVNNLPEQTKYFALDQTDPGDWVSGAEISKEQLKEFKGDIKFTLRLNFVESDKSTNQNYYRDLCVVDASGQPVRVAAPNLSYDALSGGCYLNSASENNTSMLFEFVLTQEQAKYLDKSIRFEGNNLYVSSATCENYDPSENELSDDAEKLELSVTDFYQDDVMETYSYIPKEALEKFGGDVKIRIYLEESEYMDVNMNDYVVHLYAFDIKGNYVRLYCKNHESRLNNYCIGNYQTMPEYVDMIISEEQISNLSSEGFKFHAKNAHIPYVMLASAGDELEEALLAAEAPESSAPTPTGSGTKAPESSAPTPTGSGTKAPESSAPTPTSSDTEASESSAPTPTSNDTKAPESSAPTPTISDTKAPESSAPTPTSSDTKAPESSAPTPTSSDTKAPESSTPTPTSSDSSEFAVQDIPESITIGNTTYNTSMTGTLNLSGKGYNDNDIDGLRYMIHLEEIILDDNNISDLSCLSDLKNLKKISFHNNKVKNLSFAENLRDLTVISALNNEITDISALADHKELHELWLKNNKISDISALKTCTGITGLDLGVNEITDISSLSNMNNLNELWLDNNNISDISALSKLKNITRAGFAYNSISDFTPLSNCILIVLHTQYNSVNGNLNAYKGLTITESLYADGNNIDVYHSENDIYNFMVSNIKCDDDGFTWYF